MSNDILISIVTTCFNQECFVCEAIQSVIDQSYTNWEIIFVNDCSTDNSLKTIKEYCNKMNIREKVRIINHTENKGYGISLNEGIVNSKGELVGILDADDTFFDKDAIKISVKAHIKNPKASLTYSNYNECSRKMRVKRVYKTRQLEKDETYLNTKKKTRVSHFKMCKRKYFDMTEGINPKLKQTVDKDLVLKMEEVGKLIFIDKVLYNYRKHSGNLTSTIRKKGKEYRKFLAEMRKEIFDSARERRKNKK